MTVARKITIVVRGDTEGDADAAFIEAAYKLRQGFTSGTDRNESSAYYFESTTDVPDGEVPA